MRIALASCNNLPGWEIDDAPLITALETRGVEVLRPAWDDPSIDWRAFDGCLIRTTWDYQEHQAAFVTWAEGLEIPLFNPVEIVRWNTHKGYLRHLEDQGIPIVPTTWLEAGSSVDLAELLKGRDWQRGFLKPMVGATARETLRFSMDAAGIRAAQAHADRLLPEEGLMLQPYMSRVETTGEISAIFIDGTLTHAVQKIPVPGDYRVQDDFGARDHPVELSPPLRELALRIERLIRQPPAGWGGPAACDLLYARVDFHLDEADQPYVGELELVEPSLFFRHGPQAADALATALIRRIAPQQQSAGPR